MTPADRWLTRLLRLIGGTLLLAAPCAALPRGWMAAVHRDWLGLGELPDGPLVNHLTRSASLLYALYGAALLGLAADVPRYRPVVRRLGLLHVLFGAGVFAVGLAAGMPGWWVAVEGPLPAVGGGLILWLTRRAGRGADGRR